MCISENCNEHYETIINEFKCKFDKLYENFNLPMTLKFPLLWITMQTILKKQARTLD